MKADLELRAAAGVAHVLGAKLHRRDTAGAQNTRDFDLDLSSGMEPLEVTRYMDEPAFRTWSRLEAAGPLPAPSLTRRWVLALPAASYDATGQRDAYEVRKFRAEIEPALAALERAGYDSINLGRLERDPALAGELQTLLDLGIQDGFSRPLPPGEAAFISVGAPVGGFTDADLVASAIEREAAKPDNRAKLAQPPGAKRRHLVVPFDPSSGAFFNAVDRGLMGRLPTLPPEITTAWALARSRVLMSTPPQPWQLHEVPESVFNTPEDWLA